MRSDAFYALINFRASPIDLFMKGEALVVSQEVTFYDCCSEICNGVRPKTMYYFNYERNTDAVTHMVHVCFNV